MCQHSAGEGAYLASRDKYLREKGYKAQKEGVPKEDCPEQEHELWYYSDAYQWKMGWDLAESGQELF